MKFLFLIGASLLLAACQILQPFGDATVYEPFSVSSRPGLDGRYHCMRRALSAEGYNVEMIFPERDTPNFFDVSKGNERIAQVDMYHVRKSNFMDITIISGSKQTNAELARVISPCVSQ